MHLLEWLLFSSDALIAMVSFGAGLITARLAAERPRKQRDGLTRNELLARMRTLEEDLAATQKTMRAMEEDRDFLKKLYPSPSVADIK